ncbi:hypothetical protein LFT48_00460 [Arthrobacter sp. FW305-123]|nr:hypothetical protein LFT48_00460 [Arthrobacter sp. FW305-123]
MKTAAAHDVRWILTSLPGNRGFLTPKIQKLLDSLSDELASNGESGPQENLVEHILTISAADGPTSPEWPMMNEYVRSRIGTHADLLPDAGNDANVSNLHRVKNMDALTPSLRPLVGELMDRSNVLMSHYVRQFHGDQLKLYRVSGIHQSVGTPGLHPPLSRWTDTRAIAEDRLAGSQGWVVTALVPAECVWIAPDHNAGELVISPYSAWGHSIEVINTAGLVSRQS